MKKLLLFMMFMLASYTQAQLSAPGDMAFTAFNADANDDFAVVTFVDIPANSIVYFSDKEWTGTSFNSGEESWEWQTGAAMIAAGTVIVFSDISDSTRGVTFGSYVGTPGGVSASAEAIFAYLGTDVDTPTTFLAAVANDSSAYGTFSGTGLAEGLTAITYPASTDIAAYNGTRSGLDQGGFQVALNDAANYDFQAGGGDQSNDMTAPDLPFDTTVFTISTTDVTPPILTGAIAQDQNTIALNVSEELTNGSATNLANFTINPSVAINTITYDSTTNTIILNHAGFILGVAYTVTVTGLEDLNSNVQTTAFISDPLYFNDTASGLVISEIMYNPPGSVDDDDLEFIEIYNNTTTPIELGGLVLADEGNFSFTMPEQTLNSNAVVLVASNASFADNFYNAIFLDLNLSQTNVFGNGGEQLSITNTIGAIIFEVDYDDASPWPTDADGTDGEGASIELQDPNISANDGSNWSVATNLVGQSEMIDVFASAGSFTPNVRTVPVVSFVTDQIFVSEATVVETIIVEIDALPASGTTVTVDILPVVGSTAQNNVDYTLASNTVTFDSNSSLTQTIAVATINNPSPGVDRFAALRLDNATNATISSLDTTVLYIQEQNFDVPAGANAINMSLLTSYPVPGTSPGAEIVAHDPASQRLFVMNSENGQLEVLDFSAPANISALAPIDLTLNTIGVQAGDQVEGTSVAVGNGIVAAVTYRVEDGAGNELFQAGTLALYDAATSNFIAAVEIGILPDMVGFTPDGLKILVANEGQPSDDYLTDPEGSVSVITLPAVIANLTQADVATIDFTGFNSQQAALEASGVRIFGPGATVAQDVEPEFITFSDDSQFAWVSLQENNAMARMDLNTNTITDIFAFGTKDYSLTQNALAVNNQLDEPFIANWPILGFYQPDAMAYYSAGGSNYIVTANEGDARVYGGFSEEERAGDSSYQLDPVAFPNADLIQSDGLLNRINVTTANGDTDNDGDFDEIYVYGGRSFSIFNADTGALVYDSGNDFELITLFDPVYGDIFNASNSNNTPQNRSDDKGPEPEGVIVQEINGVPHAFIGLERIGGIMVYDISDPVNPVFVTYQNNRNAVPGAAESGDLGPEGLTYVSANDNSTGTGLLVVSNEVSATVSVYSIGADVASVQSVEDKEITLYPNPVAAGNPAIFSQPLDYTAYDLGGRKLESRENAAFVNTSGWQSGIYLIKTTGQTFKLIVE